MSAADRKPMQVLVNVPADLADAHALRALNRGDASPEQQKRALKWIIDNACDMAGMPYWSNDRDTAFALGRLFVGKQIGRLLMINLAQLTPRRNDDVGTTTQTIKP